MVSRSPRVSFGSAQLLGPGIDPAVGLAVLEAAAAAGVTRLDTAPSYGAGACEALVADVAAAHPGIVVTTKVGLEPVPHPPRLRVVAGRVLSRVPEGARSVLRRARGDAPVDEAVPSGRFTTTAVRASVDRSLALLGRPLDRLLLHEVLPADVDTELIDVLGSLVETGAVREVGCATQNAWTPEVLRRGAGVLTVAHLRAPPLEPAPLHPTGVRVVHHGLLGAGGADLRRIEAVLARGGPEAVVWRDSASVAGLSGRDGLVEALLRRGAARGAEELIVASSRPDRAADLVTGAARGPLPLALQQALDRLLGAVGLRGSR